jgi:membrane-associated phospholipid phosphatase
MYTTCSEKNRQVVFKYKHHILYIIYPHVTGFFLDIVHIFCALYLYAEDGHIIQSAPKLPFWDDTMKHVDSKMTGIDIDHGVGYYLRSLHLLLFNQVLGEYLSLSYILFYLVIAFGYLIPYLFASRYSFDQITNGLLLTYLVCLTLYPIFPTKGPFWTYPRPDGHDVGFVFGPLAQYLVGHNSAIGTAFPSSHCAITTVVQILTLIYYRPLGFVFLSFCPAILVATVWLGYHYLVDSIVGFLIGCMCAAVVIGFGRLVYTPRDVYIRVMLEYEYGETIDDNVETPLFNN